MMLIVSKIQSLCKERNMTIPKLENDLNFGKGSIYKWDKNYPSIDKVQKVANYFNVSTDYLLGRTDNLELSPKKFSLEIDLMGLDTQNLSLSNQRLLNEIIKTMKKFDDE